MIRKLHYLFFLGVTLLPFLGNGQCLTAVNGQYPSNSFSPSNCNGVNTNVIATDCYAGEYSIVNVIGGNTYQFTSSISSDYITISNSAGTSSYAFGVGTQSYSPTINEAIRFYTHTDAACGDEILPRTRGVICNGVSGTVGCFDDIYGQWPANTYTTAICDGVTLNEIAPDCYAGDYSVVSLYVGNSYQFSSSVPTDFITISDATGTLTFAAGVGPQSYTPSVNEDVRFYTHTDAACGTEQVERARNIVCSGGISVSGPCLNEPNGMYPADIYSVPNCDGTPNIIAADCFAGEYSIVELSGGNTYGFESSVATDWITLTDSAGVNVLAYGPSPINSAAVTGIPTLYIRFYTHTDSLCGDEMVNRSRIVTCIGSVGLNEISSEDVTLFPNPANDKISITGAMIYDQIQLISIEGRLLKTIIPAESTTEIDVRDLDRGTYFVRLEMNGQRITKEFVKN